MSFLSKEKRDKRIQGEGEVIMKERNRGLAWKTHKAVREVRNVGSNELKRKMN